MKNTLANEAVHKLKTETWEKKKKKWEKRRPSLSLTWKLRYCYWIRWMVQLTTKGNQSWDPSRGVGDPQLSSYVWKWRRGLLTMGSALTSSPIWPAHSASPPPPPPRMSTPGPAPRLCFLCWGHSSPILFWVVTAPLSLPLSSTSWLVLFFSFNRYDRIWISVG